MDRVVRRIDRMTASEAVDRMLYAFALPSVLSILELARGREVELQWLKVLAGLSASAGVIFLVLAVGAAATRARRSENGSWAAPWLVAAVLLVLALWTTGFVVSGG